MYIYILIRICTLFFFNFLILFYTIYFYDLIGLNEKIRKINEKMNIELLFVNCQISIDGEKVK